MLLLTDKKAEETVGPLNGCVCVCNYCMFNGPFFGTAQVSRYQKGKPIWILLKQETVSDSGSSWAVCKSAPCSRQITMPAPHHSVFYRLDALPAAQSTASKHRRQFISNVSMTIVTSIPALSLSTVQTLSVPAE